LKKECKQVKKVLFAIVAVVLAIGMVGSAFAYFTDVASSNNNVIGAGTLNIQIADNDQGLTDGPVSASFNSPAGLAPGQSFDTGVVSIKNVGTINIAWIWARFGSLTETVGGMSQHIFLTKYWELDPGGVWVEQDFDAATANVFLHYWNTRGATLAEDGSISLNDLVVAHNFGSGNDITTLLLMNDSVKAQSAAGNLPAGSTVQLYFTFQLDPLMNNAFQGASASFQVDFIGSQYNGYPDNVLATYVTQPLGS
jgi:predicted ribosomally synthesized peptide with SipW-like signal peptide